MTEHITQDQARDLAHGDFDFHGHWDDEGNRLHRLCNAAIQHWIDSHKMVLPDPIGYMEFRFGTRYLHFADSKPHCAGQTHTKPLYTADQMDQAVALAKVVADDVARDAERYRWLRANCIRTIPADRDGPAYKRLEFAGKIQSDLRFAIDHFGLDAAIDATATRAGGS